jgi:hypothetical protein
VRTSANTIVSPSFRAADSSARRLGACATDLSEDRYAGALGSDLVQDFQLLGDELRACAQRRPSDVPTRPRQTPDEPRADRVDRPRHDDGYGRGGLLQRRDARATPCDDHVRLELNQLCGQAWHPLILELGVALLDHEIPSLDISEFAEPVPHRSK